MHVELHSILESQLLPSSEFSQKLSLGLSLGQRENGIGWRRGGGLGPSMSNSTQLAAGCAEKPSGRRRPAGESCAEWLSRVSEDRLDPEPWTFLLDCFWGVC